MVRFLIRLGLTIVAVTMAALIFSADESVGIPREWVKYALYSGAGLCAAGLALGAIMKLAGMTAGRRCPRCGRPVMRGHIYCEDHFREALLDARDHGVRR